MKKLLLAGLLILSAQTQAMEIADVKLADQVQVSGQTLVLNGAGLRTKFFFKIYIAALYLPQKQTSGPAVIAAENVHRVALHIKHELSSAKLYDALVDAMESNQTAAELTALEPQFKQLKQIFDKAGEVKSGDVINMDYVPGGGTEIGVNDKAYGTLSGAIFNRALLQIWLGDKPVQTDLKKAMLGSE